MPIALSAERSVAPICEGRRFSRVRPEAGRTNLTGSRSASQSFVTSFVVPVSIAPLLLGRFVIVSPPACAVLECDSSDRVVAFGIVQVGDIDPRVVFLKDMIAPPNA